MLPELRTSTCGAREAWSKLHDFLQPRDCPLIQGSHLGQQFGFLLADIGRPHFQRIGAVEGREEFPFVDHLAGNLAGLLSRGAEKLTATGTINSQALVERLYDRAFGRKPSIEEASVAKGLVGEPVKKEGVEDLLWGMAMLPEFQLIY